MGSSIRPGVVSSLLFEMKFWVRYLLPTRYLAVYYPSPSGVVDRMLKLANCTNRDTVFDLGCGDGRVLVAAGKLGARAVGYELDAELCKASQDAIQREGLQDRCAVIRDDAGNADMRTATIVCLYLSDRGNRDLMARCLPTLQPGTRVVSNFFRIEGWDKQWVKSCLADPTTGPIHLYIHQQGHHIANGHQKDNSSNTPSTQVVAVGQ